MASIVGEIELPEMLSVPKKLLPMVTPEVFNKNQYFLLEGGRSSGKTHTIGRWILYLCTVRKVRVVCGRELQSNIQESVYTLLVDLIEEFGLGNLFKVQKVKIECILTGSVITFKGFREQGRVNIKGLEGVDILWIDEAQSITHDTFETVIPTIIRNSNAKLYFSMNRFLVSDAVYERLSGREDCWHCCINYFDNEFCNDATIREALEKKRKNETEYNHIWLGHPLSAGSEYLFSPDDLEGAYTVEGDGWFDKRQRVCALDFASDGGDLCSYVVIDREGSYTWGLTHAETWGLERSTYTVGRVVSLLGEHKPDVFVLDCDGMGDVVADKFEELGIRVCKFKGSSTAECRAGYRNNRADGYHLLKEWMENRWLRLNKDRDGAIEKQLSFIKLKPPTGGRKALVSKSEMKGKYGFNSPDEADSLMMAVWGAINYVGKTQGVLSNGIGSDNMVRRIINRRRRYGK